MRELDRVQTFDTMRPSPLARPSLSRVARRPSAGLTREGARRAYSPCRCRSGAAVWRVRRGASGDHCLEQSGEEGHRVDKRGKTKAVNLVSQ